MIEKIVAVIAEKNLELINERIDNLPEDILWVELRLDYLENITSEIALKAVELTDKHIIATCRMIADGGKFAGNSEQQVRILEAVSSKVDFIDIDLIGSEDKIQGIPLDKRILSVHDFEETPEHYQLENLYERAKDSGARLVKFACFCNDTIDASRLLALASAYTDCIIVGMGEFGKRVRIEAPELGSIFTYASTGDSVAEGQLSVEEMINLYKKERNS